MKDEVFHLPVGNAMNREIIRLGEHLWYDDARGIPTECVVDAVEPGRIWVRLVRRPTGRVFFENHELGRLRSQKERIV